MIAGLWRGDSQASQCELSDARRDVRDDHGVRRDDRDVRDDGGANGDDGDDDGDGSGGDVCNDRDVLRRELRHRGYELRYGRRDGRHRLVRPALRRLTCLLPR